MKYIIFLFSANEGLDWDCESVSIVITSFSCGSRLISDVILVFGAHVFRLDTSNGQLSEMDILTFSR